MEKKSSGKNKKCSQLGWHLIFAWDQLQIFIFIFTVSKFTCLKVRKERNWVLVTSAVNGLWTTLTPSLETPGFSGFRKFEGKKLDEYVILIYWSTEECGQVKYLLGGGLRASLQEDFLLGRACSLHHYSVIAKRKDLCPQGTESLA